MLRRFCLRARHPLPMAGFEPATSTPGKGRGALPTELHRRRAPRTTGLFRRPEAPDPATRSDGGGKTAGRVRLTAPCSHAPDR